MTAPRRIVLLGLVLSVVVAPLAAESQQGARSYQIGYLGNSTPAGESALVEGFRQGLRELGYVEGQNVVIHYRWSEGRLEFLGPLADELVRLGVDVIVTSGDVASVAAKKATTKIPIVLAASGDPVGAGVVSSLARPGSNVTGLATLYPELEGKRLEVLREISPGIRRVAVLMNPVSSFTRPALERTRRAADSLRLTLVPAEARVLEDFEPAFVAIAKGKADALVVFGDRSFLLAHRGQIVSFATRQRLPTMANFREFAADGGLVALGPDFVDSFRRAAAYVDKIFKGAKPADLPVERPSKVDLVINKKTAKALGITIPQSLLLRANEIIE